MSGESETGKLYRANFKDKNGHTVLVMHPGRQVRICGSAANPTFKGQLRCEIIDADFAVACYRTRQTMKCK